jgi:hypothetical protein
VKYQRLLLEKKKEMPGEKLVWTEFPSKNGQNYPSVFRQNMPSPTLNRKQNLLSCDFKGTI